MCLNQVRVLCGRCGRAKRVQQRQPGTRTPECACDSNDVANASTTTTHRRPSLEITKNRHRNDDLIRLHEIPTNYASPEIFSGATYSRGQLINHLYWRMRRAPESNDERRRAGAESSDIRGILGNRLAPDIAWRRPVQAKMPTLNQHVGGHGRPPIWRRDERCIIAWADQGGLGLPAPSNGPIDHPKFADLRNCQRLLAGNSCLPDPSGTLISVPTLLRAPAGVPAPRTRFPMPDSEHTAAENQPSQQRHPAVIATAIALPIALIIGLIVAAVIANRNPASGPVALGTVPAPNSGSPECQNLIDTLPDELGEFHRAELVEPAPEAAAAWQGTDTEPIVLRCGLDRPFEFNQASPLQMVDEVQWFEVSGVDQGLNASTWFVVDRAVYVGVTIPSGIGPTPIQDLSAAIQTSLPAQPIDPAPIEGGP